ICERERCPFAVVGYATAEERLVVGHGALSLLPHAGEGARRADEGSSSQETEAKAKAPHPNPLPQAGEGAGAAAGEGDHPWPIDIPMDVLFGKPPKMHRDTRHSGNAPWPVLDWTNVDLHEAALRVLAH